MFRNIETIPDPDNTDHTNIQDVLKKIQKNVMGNIKMI